MPAEAIFKLRPIDEALHKIGGIAPNADTQRLVELLQKESAHTSEILEEARRFCQDELQMLDLVALVLAILIHPDDPKRRRDYFPEEEFQATQLIEGEPTSQSPS